METAQRTAQKGDTVRVHYRGTLEDGTEFDSSRGREPLEFTLGAGGIIPGFEDIVTGMSPGERRAERVAAEQAYGAHRGDLVIEVSREHVPEDIALELGQQLHLRQEGGQPVPVTVTDLSEEAVTLDANHPLAGKDLNFEIELLDIVGRAA
jgi:FKBP-type peptidyl-prolyl cis-trans isomerase 2